MMHIWFSVSQVPFLLSRNLKCKVFKERLQMKRFIKSLVVWGFGRVNVPGRDGQQAFSRVNGKLLKYICLKRFSKI